jgi:cytochrome c peroxidase
VTAAGWRSAAGATVRALHRALATRAMHALLSVQPPRAPQALRALKVGLGLLGLQAMLGLLLVLAPNAQAAAQDPTLLDFSGDEVARIASHGPWPPVPQRDASNRVDGQPAAVAFGRKLFFDRRLSADGSLACADCHRPASAFQDGLPTPQPRVKGTRNTPSLLDAGQRRWFGWDGANDSLWAASLAPLLAAPEIGHSSVTLAAQVRRDPALRRGYTAVFGEPGSDDNTVIVDLAKALAAWQATLVSPRSAFDDFRDALLRGDAPAAARYPAAAQRGLRLFIGSARCAVCHAGPSFSNGEFADVGVPFFVPGGVDSGRHGGLQRLLASRWNRLGRHTDAPPGDAGATGTRHVVQEHRHFGEFKVPPLRGVAATAPYMHDGSLPSLAAVVRHYSALNEDRLHADGERILRRLDLSPREAADLVAFLESLGGEAQWRGGGRGGAAGSASSVSSADGGAATR